MVDKRQGLNAYFAYTNSDGQQRFRFRCGGVSWGFRPVYDEAEARVKRSMYPHRVTSQMFTVMVLLKGYDEKTAFNTWMREYAEFAITPDPRTNVKMTVNVPDRNFLQVGVYRQGINYGDHVGSMLWQLTAVFEAAYDPLDKNAAVKVSQMRYDNADKVLKESLYFYPNDDEHTLSGSTQGIDYTPILDATTALGYIPASEDDPAPTPGRVRAE